MKILVIDENEVSRRQLFWALRRDHDLVEAASREEAVGVLENYAPDAILSGLHEQGDPDISVGVSFIEGLLRRQVAPFVIITTQQDREDIAAKLLNMGVFDIFRKPIATDELTVILNRAARLQALGAPLRVTGGDGAGQAVELPPRRDAEDWAGELGIIGVDPQIKAIVQQVRRIAPTPVSVLIHGETGTGKEVFAQAIHQLSDRKARRFVPLNCAVLSDTLVEDELFGHEKGAFTGAIDRRKGKFEYADQGTLFLDEIGDLGTSMQAKFLRVLQERQFERLGGNQSIATDFRLIAATHRDLSQMVAEGQFREDLMFRINVFTIHLPPLRERRGDIKLIADHFLRHYIEAFSRSERLTFSREVLRFLHDYHWPGNVRELQHFVERAVALSEGSTIGLEALPESVQIGEMEGALPQEGASFDTLVRDYKRKLVAEALQMAGNNKMLTAKLLGISRSYLFKLIKQMAIPTR